MPAKLSKPVSSAKATLASFLLLKLGQLAAVQEFCSGYLLCLEPPPLPHLIPPHPQMVAWLFFLVLHVSPPDPMWSLCYQKSVVWLLADQNPINRPGWWRGKFALFQILATRVGVSDICPKTDCPHSPPTGNQ